MRRLVVAALLGVGACSQEVAWGPQHPQWAEQQAIIARLEEMGARNDWKVVEETSPVTDRRSIKLMKYSVWKREPDGSAEDFGSGPQLVIMCGLGGLSVQVSSRGYIGAKDPSLSYRVDGGTVMKAHAGVAADGFWIGWTDRFMAEVIIGKLLKADRIALRIGLENGSSEDLEFTMNNFSEVAPDLLATCGSSREAAIRSEASWARYEKPAFAP